MPSFPARFSMLIVKTDLTRLLARSRPAEPVPSLGTDHELARIDAALERLTRGEYGYCRHCGCPIPLARLDADPTTTECGSCEE